MRNQRDRWSAGGNECRLVIGLLLPLLACADARAPVVSVRDPGQLARQLIAESPDWRTTDVAGARIYTRTGSFADSNRIALAESVTVVRRELLALIGGPPETDTTLKAHLFFVGSRDETRRLTGSPLVGFVQQTEPTGVFVYAPGYRITQLMRHELTHLYTIQHWGAPRAGSWLIEGVAVWAAGTCQGHTADELASGARARGALVPMSELALRMRGVNEDVALPQAGSFVGFLVQRFGLTAVRNLWNRPEPGVHPLGPDGLSIENLWLQHLATVRPATIDVPRVMREGC